MRYCYTETEKAPVSLEISAEDMREIRKAVDAAATADGSSYRLRRISEDLRRVLREVADQMQRGGRDLAESLDHFAAPCHMSNESKHTKGCVTHTCVSSGTSSGDPRFM